MNGRLPLCIALAAIHATGACLIRGTVVDALSGKALPVTRVFAKPETGASQPAVLQLADAQGGFCFDGLALGMYQVVAERPGYLPSGYGLLPGSDQGIRLDVKADTEAPPVKIKMLPAASISGMALDSGGQPLEDATVELRRKVWDGRWRDIAGDSTRTDDRGAFRFRRLAPGTYYVSASPPERGPTDGRQYLNEAGEPVRAVEMRTYYGGGFAFERATPIPLKPGQEVANVVLALNKVPLRRISGRVAPALWSVLSAQRPVNLLVGCTAGARRAGTLQPDGTFSVDGLPPLPCGVTAYNDKDTATAGVDLTNGDDAGVVIEPSRDFTARISARIEGAKAPARIQLCLWPPDEVRVYCGTREGDGPVEIRSLQPGVYRIASGTDALYVQTLAIDGRPKPDLLLDLREGPPAEATVVLSVSQARVEGHVAWPVGESPAYAMKAVWMDPVKSNVSALGGSSPIDAAGAFKVDPMAPGKYRFFAIEGYDEDLWGSVELAKALWERSVEVELREGERKEIPVPPISYEEWTAALRKVGM